MGFMVQPFRLGALSLFMTVSNRDGGVGNTTTKDKTQQQKDTEATVHSNRKPQCNSFSHIMKSTLERLRTWDSNVPSINARFVTNLKHAMVELDILQNKLDLPCSVTESAAYIYRKALEKKLTRGRTISVLLTTSLYAACRNLEALRTLSDIVVASNLKKSHIAKCYRALHMELDLKMPLIHPEMCLSRIMEKIGITEKTKKVAVADLENVQKRAILSGTDPMGTAAAVLYTACIKTGENITQKTISDASGITEVTMRNRFKILNKNKD